ncbi:hypothetical protein DXG01_002607 [Tephrocybe rancida]|nr:hypothetical protein DXG01_002607 [Tephrocybe rancida]
MHLTARFSKSLRHFLLGEELDEMALLVMQNCIEYMDDHKIHPDAQAEGITAALQIVLNPLDPKTQEFSFDEIDVEDSVVEENNSFQAKARPFYLRETLPSGSAPGSFIGTTVDTAGTTITQTVSATGHGVHSRFVYSGSATSSFHTSSSPVSITRKATALVEVSDSKKKPQSTGKGQAKDSDNSDSGYESHNAVNHHPSPSSPKKRACDEQDDDDAACRIRLRVSNAEPGPSSTQPGQAKPLGLYFGSDPRTSSFKGSSPEGSSFNGASSKDLSSQTSSQATTTTFPSSNSSPLSHGPPQSPSNYTTTPPRRLRSQALQREDNFYHRSNFDVAHVPEFGDINDPPGSMIKALPPWYRNRLAEPWNNAPGQGSAVARALEAAAVAEAAKNTMSTSAVASISTASISVPTPTPSTSAVSTSSAPVAILSPPASLIPIPVSSTSTFTVAPPIPERGSSKKRPREDRDEQVASRALRRRYSN